MKKLISILLTMAILFGCMAFMAVPVAAEGTASYTLAGTSVNTGDEFEIPLGIVNNPGIISLRLTITYDSDVLELKSVTDQSLLNGYTTPSPVISSPYTLRWTDSLATENNTNSGTIATLTFVAKKHADHTVISISHMEARTSSGEKITFSGTSASIEVKCNHTYGAWEKYNETQHKHLCTICGTIETAAHAWDEGRETKPATHLSEGEKTYTCTVCGATKIEKTGPTPEHSYGTWEKHNETQHKHTCACGAVEYEDHKWNAGEVTKAPTCKDTGIKTYACTVCGETKTETLPITDTHTWGEWTKLDETSHTHTCSVCGKTETAAHAWDEGKVTKPATHLSEGEKTYTCTVCGETKTEIIPKPDSHSYGAWEKHNETQHKHTCACGAVEYEDHKWNAGEVTKAPTCKDTGIKTYACTVCGETKTETLPITDTHTWGEWTKDTADVHKRTCSVCGKSETAAHSWDEGKITTAPTCKDTGVKTYTCVCGETKTETLPITTNHTWGKCEQVNAEQHKHTCMVCGKTEQAAHKWDSGVVTKRPTHTADGEQVLTCSDCGATKTERLPRLTVHNYDEYRKYNATRHQKVCVCGAAEYENHKWNEGVVTTPASHVKEGVKTYTCKDCGETKIEILSKTDGHGYGAWEKHNENQHKHTCACGEVEYADHNWNAGEVTAEPTCKDTGIKTYTCTDCGETRTELIPATGVHSFGEWQKTSETEHKHVCSVCGKEESEAHKFDDGKTCSVCGKVAAAVDSSSNSGETTTQGSDTEKPSINYTILIAVIAAVAVIAIVIVVFLVSKKKKNKE